MLNLALLNLAVGFIEIQLGDRVSGGLFLLLFLRCILRCMVNVALEHKQ